jgi:hypothetical protein
MNQTWPVKCRLRVNGETCGKRKPCTQEHDPCLCTAGDPCDYHAITLGSAIR